jgi:hypothetical protein
MQSLFLESTRSRHAFVHSLQHGRQDVMVLRFALQFAKSASENGNHSSELTDARLALQMTLIQKE